MTLPDGLYDLLVTEGLAPRIDFDRADVLALASNSDADIQPRLFNFRSRCMVDVESAERVSVKNRMDAGERQRRSAIPRHVPGCTARNRSDACNTKQAVAP